MKGMKNKIIIIGLLFSISFSSCTDWLNPKPLDAMVMEDFWKTKDDVESVLLSCYESMTQAAFMQRIILGGEVRSDNVIEGPGTPSASYAELLSEKIQPTNEYANWSSFYQVINRCNTVIKYAPEVRELDPDYTEGLLNVDMAEAYALRALVYFYLVRLYDRVPYVTEPSIDDSQNFQVSNTELEEIAQSEGRTIGQGDAILEKELVHLLEAERMAAKTRGNVFISSEAARQTKGRVTKNAVRAIMADMYLWLGNYQECIAACDRILADEYRPNEEFDSETLSGQERMSLSGSELALIPNESGLFYSADRIFNEGNSMESIFELQFNTTNGGLDTYKSFYGSAGNTTGYPFYAPDFYTYNLFEARANLEDRDARALTSIRGYADVKDAFQVGKYLMSAWYFPETGTNLSAMTISTGEATNWIFYRLPDVLLIKAEALIELGEANFEQAFDLINRVYARSNPEVPPLNFASYSDQTALEDLLLLERQREFMFEGKRWFDLVRFARHHGPDRVIPLIIRKHSTDTETIRIKFASMDAFYLPIYRDELLVSGKGILKQNPYYKTGLDK